MKKIVLTMFLLIFIVKPALALTVSIYMPENFSRGQQIYFNYTMSSNTAQQIIFMPLVFCPKSTVAPLQEKEITLAPDVPNTNLYFDKIVDSSFEPQICTASILVISPEKQTFSKNFSIVASPSLLFDLKVCKDSNCLNESKIFLKNEQVYLDYFSTVYDISVLVNITYPDGSANQITLPSSIIVSELGTFTLIAKASKNDYKSSEKIIQFAVIEGEPKFKNYFTEISNPDYTILLVILVLIAVAVIALIFVRRRKNQINRPFSEAAPA